MNLENNDDLYKELKNLTRRSTWQKGLLDVLGISSRSSNAMSMYSKDELIGLIRKYEHGNDPFERQRRSKMEEAIKEYDLTRSIGGPRYPFRDNLDEKIWETYQMGRSFTPPEMRPIHNNLFEPVNLITPANDKNNDDK